MMKKETTKRKPEALRKALVSLKRSPEMIPLFVLGLAFVVYSLRLTIFSNTTANLGGPQMGLCSFISMLFSILSLVAFMNSFPKRKKPNMLMLIVLFVLIVSVIAADAVYLDRINTALTRETNRREMTAEIQAAIGILWAHMSLMTLAGVLTLCRSLLKKLLSRINTSTVIDYAGQMTIDLEEDAE